MHTRQQLKSDCNGVVNMRRSDWKRIPAQFKSQIDGVCCVLAKKGNRSEFLPVRFVH